MPIQLPSPVPPASPPSPPGWWRCSSALPAPLTGSPPPTARQGQSCKLTIVCLHGHSMWHHPCQQAPLCVLLPRKRRAQLAPSPHPAHLAACRRHAHVVVHLFNPRRQVLHVPRVVLDLVDRDALGGVCTSTQRAGAGRGWVGGGRHRTAPGQLHSTCRSLLRTVHRLLDSQGGMG